MEIYVLWKIVEMYRRCYCFSCLFLFSSGKKCTITNWNRISIDKNVCSEKESFVSWKNATITQVMKWKRRKNKTWNGINEQKKKRMFKHIHNADKSPWIECLTITTYFGSIWTRTMINVFLNHFFFLLLIIIKKKWI